MDSTTNYEETYLIDMKFVKFELTSSNGKIVNSSSKVASCYIGMETEFVINYFETKKAKITKIENDGKD
jgi:hypothetical protein